VTGLSRQELVRSAAERLFCVEDIVHALSRRLSIVKRILDRRLWDVKLEGFAG